MTVPGALHSDHVNYLIFRYLQEHGHEESARAFYRDWHRPREYRDPESLPFARSVRRYELVSVIQDGLRHDEIQTRVARTDRRFKWSQIDPRQQVEGDVDATTTAINGSRPSSSGKRKSVGTGAGIRQVEDNGAPAVKRPRLAAAPDVQTNGYRDTMDLDVRSSSIDDHEDDVDAVSPAVASDGTGDALVMRYDSVATQTEVANAQKIPLSRIKPRSVTFNIDKLSTKIFHTAWGPNRNSSTEDTLFIAGESLCRMYKTPGHLDDGVYSLEHIDEPAVSEGCMVTAMKWHPQGRVITCAVDTVETSHTGKQTNTRRIISIGPDVGGTYMHFPNSDLLQPPGVAFRIEYSPSGDYLMIARTNMNRGSIEVWPALHSQIDAPSTQPLAWKIFEYSLSDAAWSSDTQIMACTHTEQAWVLNLPQEFVHDKDFTAESIELRNLTERTVILPCRGEVDTTYSRDDTHAIDVFFVRPYDQETGRDQIVVFDSTLYDMDAYLKTGKTFALHYTFTTAAMQPAAQNAPESLSNYGPARILATVFENGGCRLFELSRESVGFSCKPLFSEDGYSLKMSFGSASAAAWSPDGAYLAIAGYNLVQVWHISGPSDALDKKPVLTWQASRPFLEEVHPTNGLDRESSKPVCLTWNADSQKICFAVDNKVAIIECEQLAPAQSSITNGDRPT